MRATRLPGSFRDPAGHVFIADGTLYRHISPVGRDAYQRLMQSGLYSALVSDGLLLPHEEVEPSNGDTVIRPERVPMVSYPYEWCFSQLRDAALLTLRVQRTALKFGMSLKDATAYNVQFHRGRPVLIDTLSFETRRPGPWLAYRQFCQHFYAPLLLWASVDARLVRLQQLFIDGVPLPLASKLLPRRTFLRAGPLMHIHLHAQADARLSKRGTTTHEPVASGLRRKPPTTNRQPAGRVEALVESLQHAVEATRWRPRSDWSGYYDEQPSYDDAALTAKMEQISVWLDKVRPGVVWDLGANTGRFSRLAASKGARAVAFDFDPACVETMYRQSVGEKLERLLPLVSDLTNPSPAVGWANEERLTLEQRGRADLGLALALVHHLAIANNVPLPSVAAYLSRLVRQLIVEFVPKSDAMVQGMLASRDDIFARYTIEGFEQAFAGYFTIEHRVPLPSSDRVLYLMTTLEPQ